MTTSDRSVFKPDAGATAAWELARAQLARPRTQQPAFDYVREELSVRDLIARYAYTWDQGDIDGVMAFFNLREGWLTAYYYAVLDPPARTYSGLVADTVVKRDGEWRIRARSVCVDTMADAVGVVPTA